jgi:hypothetical protein
MDQCLYIKRDKCDGMLKDADLSNDVRITSVPYEFDFIGNIKRTNESHEIKSKAKACIDKINFYKDVKHEEDLVNQLYEGGNIKGISFKCDETCENCRGCDFSDENRFQTAFYTIGDETVIVCVSWTDKYGDKEKTFELNEYKKCNSVLFRHGNCKCHYKVKVSYKNKYNYINLSNSVRFPGDFLNIIINNGNINFGITSAPNGGICPLGTFPDNETMY